MESDKDKEYNASAIIQKLMKIDPLNRDCFDCNAGRSAAYASFPLGVFVCEGCSSVHKNISPVVSMLIALNKPQYWTNVKLAMLIVGGNRRARSFFEENKWIDDDGDQPNHVEAKYASKTAELYIGYLVKDWKKDIDDYPHRSDLSHVIERFLVEESRLTRDLVEENDQFSVIDDTEAKPFLQKLYESSVIFKDDLFPIISLFQVLRKIVVGLHSKED